MFKNYDGRGGINSLNRCQHKLGTLPLMNIERGGRR